MNLTRALVALTLAASLVACASKNTTPTPMGASEPLGQGLHELAMQSGGGLARRYDVYVPEAAVGKAAPMVLMLHGGGGGAENARVSSRMTQTADANGFVAVFPQGLSGPRAKPGRPLATWHSSPECCGAALKAGVDDVAYLREVVAAVSARAKVDPTRVYAVGHSNGGAMSLRLACEASDLVAAVAAVGAPGSDWSSCRTARPVPVLAVHGAKDNCAPLEGGKCGGCFERVFATLLGRDVPERSRECASVRDALRPWSERAGAEGAPTTEPLAGGASCEVWAGEGGAEVRLCVDPELGHAWPSRAPSKTCERRPNGRACTAWLGEVGPRSDTLDNGLLWAFLSRHTLP